MSLRFSPLRRLLSSVFRSRRGGEDEAPRIQGFDGFVALDADGIGSRGRAPTADVRAPRHSLGIDGLGAVLSRVVADPVQLELPNGETFERNVPVDAFEASMGSRMVRVDVESTDGARGQTRALVLKGDYRGPLFVCDIDDTLRATKVRALALGKTQPPIAGARELLSKVAALGVPIVYLSVASDRLHLANHDFLRQLPEGIYLDNPAFGLRNLTPRRATQIRLQGDYKAKVIGELKEAFPNAQLFGLGDDHYGDANAYAQEGVEAYIHHVRSGAVLPDGFEGTLIDAYSPSVIDRITSDLQRAIAAARSAGA